METFKVRGENIEVVQYFNILGLIIDINVGSQREVTKRLALGIATMSSLETVSTDKCLSVNTKGRLVKTLVFQ